jgi:hypothetical protein
MKTRIDVTPELLADHLTDAENRRACPIFFAARSVGIPIESVEYDFITLEGGDLIPLVPEAARWQEEIFKIAQESDAIIYGLYGLPTKIDPAKLHTPIEPISFEIEYP